MEERGGVAKRGRKRKHTNTKEQNRIRSKVFRDKQKEKMAEMEIKIKDLEQKLSDSQADVEYYKSLLGSFSKSQEEKNIKERFMLEEEFHYTGIVDLIKTNPSMVKMSMHLQSWETDYPDRAAYINQQFDNIIDHIIPDHCKLSFLFLCAEQNLKSSLKGISTRSRKSNVRDSMESEFEEAIEEVRVIMSKFPDLEKARKSISTFYNLVEKGCVYLKPLIKELNSIRLKMIRGLSEAFDRVSGDADKFNIEEWNATTGLYAQLRQPEFLNRFTFWDIPKNDY